MIEVMDRDVKGYWESRGYSNSANVGQFPFGTYGAIVLSSDGIDRIKSEKVK